MGISIISGGGGWSSGLAGGTDFGGSGSFGYTNFGGFTVSEIGTLTTIGGVFTGALNDRATINASKIYNYGSRSISAAELTVQNSARMTKIASNAKMAGNVFGGLGIAVTVVQYQQGQITGVEASVDAFFGFVGFLGPVGATISATYFVGKLAYETISGDTLFTKPKK